MGARVPGLAARAVLGVPSGLGLRVAEGASEQSIDDACGDGGRWVGLLPFECYNCAFAVRDRLADASGRNNAGLS